MARTILFVHGRHWKPVKNQLEELWLEALTYGIGRQRPDKRAAWQATNKEFVYYGELSNAFLSRKKGKPVPNRITDRRTSLVRLKRYRAHEFDERSYSQLPYQTRWHDALARSVGSVAKALRLGRSLIEMVAPDIVEYWNADSEYGTEVRSRILKPLRSALDRGDQVLLICHSLGAVIAWDALWRLSRAGEYRLDYAHKKVDLWITMGAPLAEPIARRHQKGFYAFGPRRYPSNIRRWLNVWAEDDYLCHDTSMAKEYADMLEYGLIKSITDEKIYNLSIRNGRSNPHCSVGYLIHPVVSGAVADWV